MSTYPEEVIKDSLEEMAEYIHSLTENEKTYQAAARRGQEFVRKHYDIGLIWEQIHRLLETGGDYEEFCD